MIDYVPKNRTPFVYFSKERISVDRLKISKENYDVRKKEYAARINSVIEYASGDAKCRSQILMEYFGETDAPPCGTCDVCKAKEQMQITDFEFEAIGKRIRKIIEKPCSYENLLLKLQGDQQKMRMVIKWLLDNKKIIYRVDNCLEWSS